MSWNYIKDKLVHFVEHEDTILKFVGFDSLDEWVKNLKTGAHFTLYAVGMWAGMTRMEEVIKNDK